MSTIITVGISEMKIAKSPDILATYDLGSCVGICLYDPLFKIGGLSHIMLPSSSISEKGKNIGRFADTAVCELVDKMVEAGAQISRIRAKIAGGAQMYTTILDNHISSIGVRNTAAVKAVLSDFNIPVLGEDTGSDYGRTIYFYTEDGTMRVRSIDRGEKTL